MERIIFFAGEVLLVIKELDGSYTVIEGNRRLTAVKLLNQPNLTTIRKPSITEISENAKYVPTILPCLVFKEKNAILKYLGFRHITGIKSWRVLEKARYLSDMRIRDYESISFLKSCTEIAKSIGSRSDYVKRLLVGYELYEIVEEEKFYFIDNLKDTKFFLNYFIDSLSRDNIRIFLGINLNSDLPIENVKKDNLKKIVFWWFEKTQGQSRVLGDSEGLKLLDAVIGNEDALMAFDKGGATIYEAYELTGDLDIQFEARINDAVKAIEQADILSNKVKSFYTNLYEDLKAIRRIALKINDFKDKVIQNGDDF
ncbi:MAG: hypothetical protein U5N85_00885 [Arcicella sp.]|nr:hypothetical protein [Arcicella sp.]